MSGGHIVTPSLLDIFVKHGTDKGGLHRYDIPYEMLLAPLLDKPITLLEIGVGHGSSLRAWREYLPNAKLVGIDKFFPPDDLTGSRCYFSAQGDQGDRAFLASVVERHGPFHVVIDDGGHLARDIVTSFETLWSSVVEGGFYALEDIHAAALDPRYNPTGDKDPFSILCDMAKCALSSNKVEPLIVLFKRGGFVMKPHGYGRPDTEVH